jgi:hypothetical protein
MQDFMPWHGLVGGMLIGLSAALFLLLSGRISGISGILENLLTPQTPSWSWSAAYILGLPLGTVLVAALLPGIAPKVTLSAPWPVLVSAGLLVGIGSRLGSGCTSGHGVCGLPRLSIRSFVAVGVFMATAALTVFVVRHIV